MKIVVTSAFRDTPQPQIERWCRQIKQLELHVGREHFVQAIAVEGDSVDQTAERLTREATLRRVALQPVKLDLGAPRFGSTEDPRRLEVLSRVLNECFDAVPDDADVVVHVESDLIWDPSTIGQLIDIAYATEDTVVAPLVFAGDLFYDVWGFRSLRGERFSPWPPHSRGLDALLPHELFEVGSAGSCLAIPGELARNVRVTNDEALVGWCEAARDQDAKIAVASWLKVRHPA